MSEPISYDLTLFISLTDLIYHLSTNFSANCSQEQESSKLRVSKAMALRWRALAVLLSAAVMVVHGQELPNSASQQEPATSSEQLDAINQELEKLGWNQDLLSQVDLEVCKVEDSPPLYHSLQQELSFLMLMRLCLQEVTKDQFGTLARNNPLGFLSLLQVMPKEASLFSKRPSSGDAFSLSL